MLSVIITGASSGIGQSLARTFSDRGWTTLLVARNEERLRQVSGELPNSTYRVCDLGEPQEIQALKEDLENRQVDALINNAGVYQPQAIDDHSDAPWEQQLQTNLMGAVRLTRLCWPALQRQKGCILNISSTLGIRPIPGTAAYSASKAAMNNWTLSLALEGAPHGIRANAICPGIVDTPIHSYVGSDRPEDQKIYQQVQGLQPLGRTGRPEDIASMAYHFCQPEAQWMTGSILNIDGGMLLNS
jgi:NAD(P)-dependent dehydrogenase (short-subunit alcohol dehydrogenase family)